MNALTTARRPAALVPTNMGEAMKLADMLARSTMVPRDYQGKPENVLVAIQWGLEVGLNPLQAVQNIAVINGRPSIWGDAALALVRGHPACVAIREGVEGEGDQRHGWCEVTRRGQAPERRTFSVAQAKKAGLFGKAGPWQQYSDRMLQLRARGFAIRDVFPDALRGVITAEEAQDMPAEAQPPRNVPNLAADDAPLSTHPDKLMALDNQLANFATVDDLRGWQADPKVREWLDRLRRNQPDLAAQADEMIAAAWARLDPDSREAGEDEAPPLWGVVSRDGSVKDCGDREHWLAEWRMRVKAVEKAGKLDDAQKLATLDAMLSANDDAFRALAEAGEQEAVAEVSKLVTGATGRLLAAQEPVA